MHRAYTLKSISGVACPSMRATQIGDSPAAGAFEANALQAVAFVLWGGGGLAPSQI